MSKTSTVVSIEICSNCKSHQWCTRHNEATYTSLAMDIQKCLQASDSSIQVEIFQVGGHKMGSFEISCNGTLLFSKLNLGYFPHVPSAAARILSFIDDFKNGRDLKKYSQINISPQKSHNQSGVSFVGSPKKEGKKIKYVPDYRDPAEQVSQSVLVNSSNVAQKDENKQKKQHNNEAFSPVKKTEEHDKSHEEKKQEKHHEEKKHENNIADERKHVTHKEDANSQKEDKKEHNEQKKEHKEEHNEHKQSKENKEQKKERKPHDQQFIMPEDQPQRVSDPHQPKQHEKPSDQPQPPEERSQHPKIESMEAAPQKSQVVQTCEKQEHPQTEVKHEQAKEKAGE